jgi:hypothetical protein
MARRAGFADTLARPSVARFAQLSASLAPTDVGAPCPLGFKMVCKICAATRLIVRKNIIDMFFWLRKKWSNQFFLSFFVYFLSLISIVLTLLIFWISNKLNDVSFLLFKNKIESTNS